MTARPALADVLSRVTTESDVVWWRMMLLDSPTRLVAAGVEWKMGPRIPWALLRKWRHPSPAEALEALADAALLPAHYLDAARAPRWWCETCRGDEPVIVCGGAGHLHHTTHAALVAVASLGVADLARAEELVAETWPGRALVWRPMTREALREHHAKAELTDTTDAWTLPRVFSVDAGRLARGAVAWDEKWPYDEPSSPSWAVQERIEDAKRAWPALRAIAALGLHLVALDDARVVLAVEHVSEGQRQEVAA